MNIWIAVNEIEEVFRTGHFVRGLMLYLKGIVPSWLRMPIRGTLKSGGMRIACVSLESALPCSSGTSP